MNTRGPAIPVATCANIKPRYWNKAPVHSLLLLWYKTRVVKVFVIGQGIMRHVDQGLRY